MVMLKYLIVMTILACIGVFSAVMVMAEKSKPRPNNWVEIYELKKVPGIRSYYDSNSLTDSGIRKSTVYSMAELMVSFDPPKKLTVNEKELVVTSIVKLVLADCRVGLITPMYDIYFDVGMPTRESLPIGGTKYSGDISGVSRLRKDSPIYNILCAESI